MAVAPGGWLDKKYRRALEPVFLNLVATVLAVAAPAPIQAPFTELPVQPEPAPITQRTITQNLVITTLVGQDQIYGEPGQAPTIDIPVPKGPPPGPISNRTWTSSSILVIGQDRIYGDPGQAPTVVFPNPVLPLRLRPDLTQNLQPLHTQLPPGELSLDLPPRGPTRLRPDFIQNLSTTTMVGQGTLYGAPGQAPNLNLPNPPLPPRRNPQYEQGPNLQSLLGVVEAAPPGSRSLDLPIVGPTRLRPDLAQNLSTTTLVGQDQIYGEPGQAPTVIFPGPVLPRRVFQTDPPQNLQSLLSFVEDLPPGKRFLDLPTRSPNRLRPDLIQSIQPLVNQLPPGDLLLELPVRPLARLRPDLTQNLTTLLYALPPGEAVVELPPRGYRRLPPLQEPPPFKLVLLGPTIYGAPGQAPTIIFPVPKGYPPGPITNRSWMLRTLQMIGQDTIYGAPGQVPTRVGPNPRGYPPGPNDNRSWISAPTGANPAKPIKCIEVVVQPLLTAKVDVVNPVSAETVVQPLLTAATISKTVTDLEVVVKTVNRVEIETQTLLQGAVIVEPNCDCEDL